MRPPGGVRQALLVAAQELGTAGLRPTLVELAHRACVGLDAARRTVDNLRRAGHLHVVGGRRVSYTNRLVAEYACSATPP